MRHKEYTLWTFCTKRNGMLPFIWLPFQVWFTHSSKKDVNLPLLPAQQGLCDCIALHCCTSKILWGIPFPLLTHAQSIGKHHPTWKQGVELCCSPREGHPVQKLSWTASLPFRNALTHRATVRYCNAASPHVSRSPREYSCVLRNHATSILIQERCSSFVNMIVGRMRDPYESQCSTHFSR